MSLTLTSDSVEQFTMPAEWFPHQRCWMAWPARQRFWPDIEATRRAYALVANSIARFEPVTMVVNPADSRLARELLGQNVSLLEAPMDDSWCRDSGPNFLCDGSGHLAGSCWRFNAWGENYHPYDQDALMGQRILDSLGLAVYRSTLTCEGGAITVDGEGTVITTESCLLNANRNPGWEKAEVEAELCKTLGVKKVIWLPGNPLEEETNGHVDGIAQFIRPGLVLMEYSPHRDHPWYDIFQENIEVMRKQRDAQGRELELVFIEDCAETESDSDRFCTSYINAYLANGAVIMPAYGYASDERARSVYETLYPHRTVCQLNIDAIAVGGGGIHCITQQQPRASF